MGFLGKLLLGNGTLRAPLRQELEAEGLVRIEEDLHGSVRYEHFKAPGKRFHGKITPERIGLGDQRAAGRGVLPVGAVEARGQPVQQPALRHGHDHGR